VSASDSILRLVATLAACAAATALSVAFSPARADDARVRSDLEAVSRRSVFFGHQSVGSNILDGIRELATREGLALRVEEVETVSDVRRGTLAHGFMDANLEPFRKLESFRRAIGTGPGKGVDVALLKFCYIDITPDSDVRRLFEQYQLTIQGLRASHPETTFVHVTIPLMGLQGGIKGAVKRLLGRAPYGITENARREEYNALLRQAYQGREPVFDLARVESTNPDGRTETAEWKGRTVPMLVPAYTDDGGHLNAQGRQVAARALLAVLASAPAPAAAASPVAR
jgi:hypothetical protein